MPLPRVGQLFTSASAKKLGKGAPGGEVKGGGRPCVAWAPRHSGSPLLGAFQVSGMRFALKNSD